MSMQDRKVLAVFAGAAMVLSSFVGVGAATAVEPNNVDLTPSVGERFGTFATDSLNVSVDLPRLVNSTTAATYFALAIQNPDSESIQLTFNGTATANVEYTLAYVDALGNVNGAATAEVSRGTARTFAFADNGSEKNVSLVLSAFNDDGTYSVPTDIDFASTSGTYGDDQFSITTTAWIDGDGDTSTVDTANAASETITFYDPGAASPILRLERTEDGSTNFNDAGDAEIFGTLHFSKMVNLDQVDLTQWQFEEFVDSVSTTSDVTAVRTVPSGYDSADEAGKMVIDLDGSTLVKNKVYQIKTTASEDIARVSTYTPRTFSSNGFEVVTSSDDGTDGITMSVEADANLSVSASAVTLRTGSTDATYTLQITSGGAVRELANQPVVVVAKATSGTVAIAGSADGVVDEGAVIWNTTTDSDGQVTAVVSSSAVEGDSYTLNAHVIASDGAKRDVSSVYTATYDDGVLATGEADSSVYTGATVTINVTVEDNFEQPLSVDADGDTVRVTAVATDSDNLEQTVNIVDGTATITFDNYLSAGESDTITLDFHTGPYDDKTADLDSLLADVDVTLYADAGVGGVTVNSATLTTIVGYTPFSDDPILDGDDPTLSASNDGTITGTVVDDAGAGIPGAAVTMTAPGVQFQNTTGSADDYAVGTISFAASEAGTFTVNAWSHVADDVVVTVTSGGESATVTLEGELASTIDAGNLVLSWNLPESPVYNTTYAVTANLTDVWGNGIDGTEFTFNGEAAAEFNSVATVTKASGDDGAATAYLRSLEDVSGLAAVSVEVSGNTERTLSNLTSTSITDDEDTPWDESAWNDSISEEITFLTSAPAASSSQKVNAGSFKGYVAVYARGYEGQRLSAKIGDDWVIVDPIVNNESDSLFRVTDFTGAGVDIAVRIYIDRVLIDTINLTTK